MSTAVSKITGWTGGGGLGPGPIGYIKLFYFDGYELLDKSSDLPAHTVGYGVHIFKMDAFSENDVWAATKDSDTVFNPDEFFIFHFNGNVWSKETMDFANTQWHCSDLCCVEAVNETWVSVHNSAGGRKLLRYSGTTFETIMTEADIPPVYGAEFGLLHDLDNGDLYCFGTSIGFRDHNEIGMHVDPKDEWTWESYPAGMDNVYGAVTSDGTNIYYASRYGIWQGSFGSWTKILDISHIIGQANWSGIQAFSNGDLFIFLDLYPSNWMISRINNVWNVSTGDPLDGIYALTESQYLIAGSYNPEGLIDANEERHMFGTTGNTIGWMSGDKYANFSKILPEWLSTDSSEALASCVFFVSTTHDVTKYASGDGSLFAAYAPDTNEWFRLNSCGAFNGISNILGASAFTAIFGVDETDMWIGGGATEAFASHGNGKAMLNHFDGDKTVFYPLPAEVDPLGFQCCCIHGNSANNIYAIFYLLSSWYYVYMLKWNGTAWVFDTSIGLWGTDFGSFYDNAGHKLFVLPNGNIYVIGAYVHFWNGSVWSHESPTGCDWDTTNDSSAHTIGIGWDGSNIYVAKSGLGIWKGTFGSWEKAYTFVNGETGIRTDQLLHVELSGDVWCGSNNGRMVRYDATLDTWSSSAVSPAVEFHGVHSVSSENNLQIATGVANNRSVGFLNKGLSSSEIYPPVQEEHPGSPNEVPIGYLAAYGFLGTIIEGRNWSYEIAGTREGDAESWPHTVDDGAETIAGVESSMLPYEIFERAWGDGNHLSSVDFDDEDLLPAKFHDEAGEVESFIWEWKQPIKDVSILLAQAGRPSPIYANPNDALDIGIKYKDLDTGGHAIMMRKEGVNSAYLTKADYLFRPSVPSKGFGIGEPFGVGHEIAEYHQGRFTIAVTDGILYAFLNVIPNTPIHAKISDRDATLKIWVTIQEEQHTITDDGEGNLVSDSDIFGNPFANTIQYGTGAVSLQFNKAPDAGEIIVYYDYGVTKITRVADNESNLPYLSSISNVLLPPFNHGSIDEFQTPNLAQAEFAGTKQPEDFESDWQNNENHQDMFGLSDLTTATFDPVVVQNFEDFEEYWKSNHLGNATHFPPPSEAGTAGGTSVGTWTGGDNFEDFEGTWNSVQV